VRPGCTAIGVSNESASTVGHGDRRQAAPRTTRCCCALRLLDFAIWEGSSLATRVLFNWKSAIQLQRDSYAVSPPRLAPDATNRQAEQESDLNCELQTKHLCRQHSSHPQSAPDGNSHCVRVKEMVVNDDLCATSILAPAPICGTNCNRTNGHCRPSPLNLCKFDQPVISAQD
jgi:hypothetical protein